MRIFTTPIPVVLLVDIYREIKISLCEKCQLSDQEAFMDMSDKPVTNPHPFFIVHRFNVRYSSNFI
jgi:hypothetical protein